MFSCRVVSDCYPADHSPGFPGGSAGKESACNVGDTGSIPGSDKQPGRLSTMRACGSQPLDHDTTQATDFYLPSGEGSPRLPRCCTGKRGPQPALPSPERGWVPRARARPCASAGRPRQGCRFLRAWHCRPIHRPRPGALEQVHRSIITYTL